MSWYNVGLRLMGIGWYVALCIVLGTALGLWLDGKLHTRPIFTIAGLVLGVVLAFYGLYRMLATLSSEVEKGNRKNS